MPLKINGTTSGSTTITAPATGTDETIELSTALAAKAPLASPALTGTPTVNGTAITAIGGLVYITGGSLSGSSLVVNNAFTSTYDNYRIIMRYVPSTTANQTFRPRASGTDETGANYSKAFAGYYVSGAVAQAGTTGGTSWDIGQATTTYYTLMVIDLINPKVATATQISYFSWQSNSIAGYYAGGSGYLATSGTYDGFTFATSTGTFSGGDYRIYGYRNS